MTTAGAGMAEFRYDAGEHRVKHCWNKPEADFEKMGAAVVGKCPNTLSKQDAELLLRDGVPLVREGETYPARVYAVHEGVIFEAVPTIPGVSYHGYPWRRTPGRNPIPSHILSELEQRAVAQGQLRQFKDWMAHHGR